MQSNGKLRTAGSVLPEGAVTIVCNPPDQPKNRRVNRLASDYNPIVNLDDDICYCYHVSMRKLVQFARRERPERPSMMSQCLNAGTGCGWCIPFLIRIARDPDAFRLDNLTPEEYAARRQTYRASGGPKNTFES